MNMASAIEPTTTKQRTAMHAINTTSTRSTALLIGAASGKGGSITASCVVICDGGRMSGGTACSAGDVPSSGCEVGSNGCNGKESQSQFTPWRDFLRKTKGVA